MSEDDDYSPLNELAWDLVHQILAAPEDLLIEPVAEAAPGVVLDFGVEATGGLAAGLALAEVCMAGLCDLSIVPGTVGGIGWPQLFVQTENPLEACLFSQYAGWKIETRNFFGMGSGPMRAVAAREELFHKFEYQERGTAVVGVLETNQLPDSEVVAEIARACGVSPQHVALLCAPVTCVAGNLQVVARSVETALHKLHSIGFDVSRVEQACGWAPISPVGVDMLQGIGRTNDAILHGGRVTLWVHGDDESIRELGPRVPSSASGAEGKLFADLFEEAGRDFYKMDPLVFSPAEIVFQNLETGRVSHFGGIDDESLKRSFGL